MPPTKILYISHGHPEIQMGGAEVFAYELFQGFRALADYEPVFLARTFDRGYEDSATTPFRVFQGREDEILWYTHGEFDWLNKTLFDKGRYTVHFRGLLEALRPDVVHIQHLDGIGLNVIRQIREFDPTIPIVYTLHELQAICHAGGLMLRSNGTDLCYGASPAQCHQCFPAIAPVSFSLRRKLFMEHLRFVDMFLAPSEFLRQRYIEWGIPPEKIRFEDYGRIHRRPVEEPASPPPRGWIGFFGQVAPHKGLLVLLDAVHLLIKSGFEDFHIFINGSNLEQQREDFQEAFRSGVRDLAAYVTYRGPYDNTDVGQRMTEMSWVLVPSTWWENSPLVIQESFMHGRPVLCSDIGGMAEKVRDEVDGLHFRVGDAASLARTIRRAATTPGLWSSLEKNIRPIYSVEESLQAHQALYSSLVSSAVVA